MDPADTEAVRSLKDKRPSTVGQPRAIMFFFKLLQTVHEGFLSYCRATSQPVKKNTRQ